MKKHTYKIIFTIIWIITGIVLLTPPEDNHQIGDVWRDSDGIHLKLGDTSYSFWDNLDLFALFMLPVIGIWLWTLFKNESDGKPVKRKSRMM